MVAFVLTIIVGFGVIHEIFLPVLRYNQKQEAKRFALTMGRFKALVVRKHYIAMQDLSLDQIQEHFDVDSAYDQLTVQTDGW